MVNLLVKFLYLWFRRGREAVCGSFNKESFGGFSEVRYHVRDVTLGDAVLLRRCLGSCGTRAYP